MEKFLFIIREDIRQLKDTPGLQQQRIQEMTKWSAALAESGNNIGGNALETHGSYIKMIPCFRMALLLKQKNVSAGLFLLMLKILTRQYLLLKPAPMYWIIQWL